MEQSGSTGPMARRDLIATLVVVGGALSAVGQEAAPADELTIRAGMEVVIEHLDAPAYAARVTWDEHVVLCYELALGRAPSARELFLFRAYQADLDLRPSTALSFVLRGEEPRPSWAQCRDFLRHAQASAFWVDERVRERVRRLLETPRRQVLAGLTAEWQRRLDEGGQTHPGSTPPYVAYEHYNTFFGYLHAHSELSDGTGTPLEAYTYARDQGELDFFALTDHGELLAIWPWEMKWEQLVDAAEATYEPGRFATLWGFEWSHPLLGHINVLNTDDYTGALNETDLAAIYDWLVARPAGFGRFNHPGRYDDTGTEFMHLAPYPAVAQQMVGVGTWNKGDSFDTYYYAGGWFSPFSYWDEGNQQGWYLGALGGQDNHEPDWGTRNDYRVAVLAKKLTRESIREAYLARRFYSTEDRDLVLDLRARGFPMGSRVSGAVQRVEVRASDGGGDLFEEVRLYRDGALIETRPVSGPLVKVAFTGPFATGSYYYTIVRQTDDQDGNGRNDEAISSPIWLEP